MSRPTSTARAGQFTVGRSLVVGTAVRVAEAGCACILFFRNARRRYAELRDEPRTAGRGDGGVDTEAEQVSASGERRGDSQRHRPRNADTSMRCSCR